MTEKTHFAYVGSRTNQKRKAQGEGLTVFAVEGRAWRRLQVVDIPDPSFLAFDRDARWLYVAQGDGSEVAAYARDQATGMLELLNRRPAHGINGVHVVVDPTNRFLVVTNHLTAEGFVSNLAVFPIGADGALGEATDIREIAGEPGPNRVEQPYAKPHHVQFSPDGQFMAMADKGLDEVLVFRLGRDGQLNEVASSPTRFRWGCGPRHLVFHPNGAFLYVLNELDSTVTVNRFDRETAALAPFQVAPSQSEDYSKIHRASEIEISKDGRFLYTANRGQDTIGVFAVDPESGRLSAHQFSPSGGRIPRHFAFSPDGRDFYVANEFTHSIEGFAVGEDGRLAPTGRVAETGSPTCILMV